MQFVSFCKSEIEQSIPDRFSEQVRRHPNRIAIADSGQAYTYRELSDWSNQIAHAILAERGDIQEPVGILLEQGCSPSAVILGALKAGKIYVAMEPSDPDEHLLRIVSDCRPSLIITDSKHASLARRLAHNKRGCLNIAAIGANAARYDPGVFLSADSIAYIFYTSGSTGPPKGVFDCHRNVLHNVMRYTNNLHIVPGDRQSLIQSCSFSGTVSSMFSALLNGATLCPFNLQNQGVVRMAKWLNSEKITILHCVPTIFDQLLGTGESFAILRAIRLEGDQSFLRHVRQFQDRFGANCILANGFGATETGLIRQLLITSNTKISGQIVPIGYDIEDMFVRLTDESGCDVPQGSVGQITVRSQYLAKGYWQRPEQSAEAFKADPGAADTYTYRSGDLGRMMPDGCLEYLGRSDFQAKIRGRRVDTAEIENVLQEHASIENALVMVREDSPGSQMLVAYVVIAKHCRLTVTAIRRFLATSLPTIMLPAKFVFLDRLVTDRNGKIDRRALPIPNQEHPLPENACVAPMSFRQKTIAGLFSEVLGIDRIGLHSDFLELGGDSLKATQLLLLLDQHFGTRCSPELLFREGTVFAIDRDFDRDNQLGCIVNMQMGGNYSPLFCMHDGTGYVFGYRKLAPLLGPERPVFGVQCSTISSLLDSGTRLDDIARRHVVEMRKVQPEGPYNICGQCFGGLIAFAVAQQLRADGEHVSFLALIDTRFPSGPLFELIDRLVLAVRWIKVSRLSASEIGEFLHRQAGGLLAWIRNEARIRFKFAKPRFSVTRNEAPNPIYVDPLLASRQLELHYRPGQYDGDVTLICPSLSRNQLRWRRVASRQLKVVEIPVARDHHRPSHLTLEPDVFKLAETLRELLDQST